MLLFKAFGLSKENLQVNPEREHIEKTVLQEYKQNLNIEENIIPDPTDLNLVRWMKKMEWKNGQDYYFSDISRSYGFALGKDNSQIRMQV